MLGTFPKCKGVHPLVLVIIIGGRGFRSNFHYIDLV